MSEDTEVKNTPLIIPTYQRPFLSPQITPAVPASQGVLVKCRLLGLRSRQDPGTSPTLSGLAADSARFSFNM